MSKNASTNDLYLMDIERYKTVSAQFNMLGDPNRLRIFTLLCHTEVCVSEIANIMSMSVPAVSSSLKLLKSAELISSRREGKEIYYRIHDCKKCQLLHYALEKMIEIVCPGQHDQGSDARIEMPQTLNPAQRHYIERIHDDILEHLDQRRSIESIAAKYSMSPSALKYQFKLVYGKSIAAHIKSHRLEKAEQLLKASDLTIQQIALSVGYTSPSKFSIAFKETFGLLPKEYRRLHAL